MSVGDFCDINSFNFFYVIFFVFLKFTLNVKNFFTEHTLRVTSFFLNISAMLGIIMMPKKDPQNQLKIGGTFGRLFEARQEVKCAMVRL